MSIVEGSAGAATEYWETAWAGELRTMEGPLEALLARHLPPRGRVLEAGCGQGHIATGMAAWGYDVVGVDLARRALARLRARERDLPLAVADVGRMPFPDRTFDAVVSIGVVEHAEEGPHALLVEHRRVLRDGGVLLVTVPHRSWYRRGAEAWHLGVRRRSSYTARGREVQLRRAMVPDEVPGRFHQYELPRRRVVAELEGAGFRVEAWRPYGVAHALGETPLGRRRAAADATGPDAAAPPEPSGAAAAGPASARGGVVGALRRPVLAEEAAGPLDGAVRAVAVRALGHMQMVVARRVG